MGNWKENFVEAGIPQSDIDEFELMYVDEDDNMDAEVIPDPYVNGTFALKITRPDEVGYMLLTCEGFEGVEFESWPPKAGELQFF